MQAQKKNRRLNGLLEVIPRLWWSKDENDEYLDLTWVSPKYTLETSKQKKQTLRRSPVYSNFCKTVTMIARHYFSCVILCTLRGRVRQDETLKKMVHLPYLYHFLYVDFKHFSWLKIYRIFFENICHDSFITGSPNFSPVLPPAKPSFRGVLITSFLHWDEKVVSINLRLNSQ